MLLLFWSLTFAAHGAEPPRAADAVPCPEHSQAKETESFVQKVFRALSRNVAERSQIAPSPHPSYREGLNELRFERLTEDRSYPVDPPGLRRGKVTLRGHLLKDIDRNFSERGGINWITYQSRWDLSQACYALRGHPAPGSRPISPLTSRLNDKQKLNLAIRCHHDNDQEMQEDPGAPAEYYCVTNQEISFECEVTWKE